LNIHEHISEYLSIWKETDAQYNRIAKLSGVSDTAFWLLYCIWQFGENLTQRDIREQWSISKQTVNSALKELEKKHIISLCKSEGDKRSKLISLTEEGYEFAEKYLGAVCKAEEAAFEKMSDSERDAMLHCAQRYLDLFKAESDRIFTQEIDA
jgi:DNA-binding MarR family transcriptional regulator